MCGATTIVPLKQSNWNKNEPRMAKLKSLQQIAEMMLSLYLALKLMLLEYNTTWLVRWRTGRWSKLETGEILWIDCLWQMIPTSHEFNTRNYCRLTCAYIKSRTRISKRSWKWTHMGILFPYSPHNHGSLCVPILTTFWRLSDPIWTTKSKSFTYRFDSPLRRKFVLSLNRYLFLICSLHNFPHGVKLLLGCLS